MTNLTDQIEALLPQTQCTRCGYAGCRPYAAAIANGTPHNQCPPGGTEVIEKLADLLNRPVIALNPKNGEHLPNQVAVIDENACIGCTKCLQACPVDAIIGSGKLMHTVLTDACNGCELCIEPCPVDCIDLVTLPADRQDHNLSWHQKQQRAQHYYRRYHNRLKRLQQRATEKKQRYQKNKAVLIADKHAQRQDKLHYIQQAIARRQQTKRQQHDT